jgi:predicted RNA-binding protein with PUA-like domain
VKNFWLVKSEPETYSWADFVKEKRTSWTGVRNFSARNSLRAMREGDEVLFYHSGQQKAVVGLAKVAREAYKDKTATEGDWSTVDLVPARALAKPVTLEQIKKTSKLKEMKLVRQSRLSVMPLTTDESRTVMKMADAKA